MRITSLEIQNFRNFEHIKIKNVESKTLLIGANDVGKTNLIFALRLLLDKSLKDFEPEISDFNAYLKRDKFVVKIEIENLKEKKYGKHFSLSYFGYKNKDIEIFYKVKGAVNRKKVERHFYIEKINLEFIPANRDLDKYIKEKLDEIFYNPIRLLIREKLPKLLEKGFDEEQITETISNEYYQEQDNLENNIQNTIKNVSVIKNLSEYIDNELRCKISSLSKKMKFQMNVTGINWAELLRPILTIDDVNLKISSNGRLQQFYFILLLSVINETNNDNLSTIYCIEEPETFLHPNQQLKISKYLSEADNQLIITTHSPQIVSEFSLWNIVRLYQNNSITKAVAGESITKSINDFSFRMNIIASETFFSDFVFLVEGVSELIFFKTLSKRLLYDLNYNNVSILMVNGIGFETYLKILNSLQIKTILRTDNDIIKNGKSNYYRAEGILRSIKFYKYFEKNSDLDLLIKTDLDKLRKFNYTLNDDTIKKCNNLIKSDNKDYIITDFKEDYFKIFKDQKISEKVRNKIKKIIQDERVISCDIKSLIDKFRNQLQKVGIYVSKFDLEIDLTCEVEIRDVLFKYYKTTNLSTLINKMQEAKGNNIFDFLSQNETVLQKLGNSELVLPLKKAKEYIDKNK